MNDFTVFVIGAAEPERYSGDVATVPGKGTELHSIMTIRQWFAPVAKEVPADKLLASFEKTQMAIDAMLERLNKQEIQGFLLDELEVSLAVSGEGTIGFVTASAEAGVVLKFKRKENHAKPIG